ACQFVMLYDGWPPAACDRCACPFFWFLRSKPMAKTLFCRYPDCQKGYTSVGGEKPLVCPNCEMPARWTTTEPSSPPMPPRAKDPFKMYLLSSNDRRILRSLRIAADVGPTASPSDA